MAVPGHHRLSLLLLLQCLSLWHQITQVFQQNLVPDTISAPPLIPEMFIQAQKAVTK